MVDGFKVFRLVGIIRELCPELETAEAGKPLHLKRLPFLRNFITVGSRRQGCLTWEDALALSENVPVETVYMRVSRACKPPRRLQYAVLPPAPPVFQRA
jgi:fatty-acyl-CoA synthase